MKNLASEEEMMSRKVSHETFVKRAIRSLHNPKYKHLGIHVVYSGFNEAFRKYFGDNPVPVIDALVERGVIEKRIARGGCLIFLAGEAPDQQPHPDAVDDTIDKILNGDSSPKHTREETRER